MPTSCNIPIPFYKGNYKLYPICISVGCAKLDFILMLGHERLCMGNHGGWSLIVRCAFLSVQRSCISLLYCMQEVSQHSCSIPKTDFNIRVLHLPISLTAEHSTSCSVQQAFQSIRKIPFAAFNNIEKQPFAKGVYGKCFCASMSVSIKVCIKAFRTDKHLVSVFPSEAVITSNLCHPNLPWIYDSQSMEVIRC